MNRFTRVLLLSIVLTLVAGAFPAIAGDSATYPGGTFFDDDNSIFENEIEALAAAGVTRGCNAERTNFCPDKAVTRGQMAAFLTRALHLTDQDPDIDFTDDNESIFQNDIEKLATAGITSGCGASSANTFCPDKAVTRGQMAAFLTRALDYPKPSVPDRQDALAGGWIDTIEPFAQGDCSTDNGTTCTLTVYALEDQDFHFYDFWFSSNWSSASSTSKNLFLSDAVRIEATFDGAPLALWEHNELDPQEDLMYKEYSYQFYGWLRGEHQLEVTFIDEETNYENYLTVTIIMVADESEIPSEAPSAVFTQEGTGSTRSKVHSS